MTRSFLEVSSDKDHNVVRERCYSVLKETQQIVGCNNLEDPQLQTWAWACGTPVVYSTCGVPDRPRQLGSWCMVGDCCMQVWSMHLVCVCVGGGFGLQSSWSTIVSIYQLWLTLQHRPAASEGPAQQAEPPAVKSQVPFIQDSEILCRTLQYLLTSSTQYWLLWTVEREPCKWLPGPAFPSTRNL